MSDPTDPDDDTLNADLSFDELVKRVVRADAEPEDTDASDED